MKEQIENLKKEKEELISENNEDDEDDEDDEESMEESEEEKLRKVSKEIIDDYNIEVFVKTFFTSVLTFIPIVSIILISEKRIPLLIVSLSLVIFLPTIFYIFYEKKLVKENEDFKLAKETIKRYTDLEKEEKNKEKIKETLEKNKENSKNIKMMKEFLNK